MLELTITSTLCPHQSLPPHIYHGQSYARVDLNSHARVDFIPQSGTLDLASERIEERSAKVRSCIFNFEGWLKDEKLPEMIRRKQIGKEKRGGGRAGGR
jgi:hypothetical protein